MEQFLTNFYTVFLQVLILFIFMGFGFFGAKKSLITKEGSKVISDIILYFVTPCLIVNSFNIAYDSSKLAGLIVCFVAFMAIQAASAGIGFMLFRKGNTESLRILRFATVFSNTGYMGIPLQKAILGDEGVFYGSVCVAAFNIFVWTFGIMCMSGDKKQMTPLKLVFNPGIIATAIGLVIFLFSVKLPTAISSAIGSMAELNTPLAMMVIGAGLAGSNILSALKKGSVYVVTALRLIIIPLTALGVLLLCEVRGTQLISLIIAVSAPVAGLTTVFSVKHNNDTSLSVNLVALTTLLSIVTMSAVVAVAQMLA